MQIQRVSDGTFRKVRNNIDRLFDKNLTDLIRGIRNNKENEARYIATCIEEIKVELRQDLSFIKANAIEKLAYLQMIGYDISWAAFNIIEVMASTKFNEKRIGYLTAAQSFNDETDVLMLTTNLIRKDLQSSTNIYDVGISLSGLACFVNLDLARDLVNDVVNLLSSTRPYVRKKALLLLYKIYLKYPESLRSTFSRLKDRLEDQDPGVQSAAVNVICELARKNPRNYIGLQNIFFKLLNTSSNNWMLIKIIKLFGSLVPYESKLGRRLLEPLTNLINSTSAMSLLYECINTVIAILISISSEGPGDYTPSIQLCVQKLGVLIEDSDQNLKYLGLLAMGKILQTHPKAVQAHKDIVLRCLEDKDESIRLRALDLLYGMITKKNIIEIVRKLMEHLDTAEGSFYRDELLRRIVAICSFESYKYITNFEWYISVLVELTKVEGTKHGNLIAEQIRDVAVRVQSVRHFAVSQMVLLVQNAQLLLQGHSIQKKNMTDVLLAAAWICGEYAQHVNDIPTLLDSMLRLKLSTMPGTLLSVYVQNIAKLYAFQLCKLEADNDWEEVESLDNLLSSKLPEFEYTDHLEAQERACNLMAFLKFAIEKHSERRKVGSSLIGCFKGDLNPVAEKAQKRVPIPDGLNLDECINEPDELTTDEERNDWEEEDLASEEAVGRVLSPQPPKTTTHYGGENQPQHGYKRRSIDDKICNTEQSPSSYHHDNSLLNNDKRRQKQLDSESKRKRRELEQENNPFYVKDNPTKQRPNRIGTSSTFPVHNQPEYLQSPLEIAGVVGLERYMQQKDSTLSWKNVEKSKKKRTSKENEKAKKRQQSKRQQENLTTNVDFEHDEEDNNDKLREQPDYFVYKGEGEMPEGALSSSENEQQLNDEFAIMDIDIGINNDIAPMSHHDANLDRVKKPKKKKLKSKKDKLLETTLEPIATTTSKTRKKRKSKTVPENEVPGADQQTAKKGRKKKLSGNKTKLRNDYTSIDSPELHAEEQLISLDDDVSHVQTKDPATTLQNEPTN